MFPVFNHCPPTLPGENSVQFYGSPSPNQCDFLLLEDISKFGSKTNVEPEKNYGCAKILGPKFFMDPTNLTPKKCWSHLAWSLTKFKY